ncbi:MAG TPA: iron-sulfur cluster assembly accessory protein [Candidatus Bilamarchaeaceae archaeon]|nr:iron-sulfur cluster assembly accessory protein [Candidatus Bilamarchaeaceae archaeon]
MEDTKIKPGIKQITKDLTIGEVILEYPEIVPKLQEYGIHCIGCHVSAYEKIGEGFASHGFTEDKIDKIIAELNSIILNNDERVDSKKSIEFTDEAVKKLNELMEKQDKKQYGVRISAQPAGCSGYSYGMQFDKEEKEGDTILESKGLKIFIDKQSLRILNGTSIDFTVTETESGFKFNNPSDLNLSDKFKDLKNKNFSNKQKNSCGSCEG